MKKLALRSVLVLSISVITCFYAFAGNLDPNAPPGPTMHTLNEIYNLIEEKAGPRYEYKYIESIYAGQTITIHEGSGVVHSVFLGRSVGSNKVPLSAIQAMMGHSSINETTIYIHVSDRLRKEALEMISITGGSPCRY